MTIRFRLMMGAIAVILVANSVISLMTVVYLEDVWLKEVQTRVRLDLNSARAAYQNHIEQVSRSLAVAALCLERKPPQAEADSQASWDEELRKAAGLDFVTLLDAAGRVERRAHKTGPHGDSLADNMLVAYVLKDHTPAAGSILTPAAVLAREGADLAAQAHFTLVPTPVARPTEDQERADGMVVAAAVPIFDAQHQLRHVLYGGNLLNRRNELVDAIKQEVFPDETFEGKNIGTVTIFQGDLRIATNVTREDGARAVGTRMSDAVYRQVLEQGKTWSAPAFVVNDWYLTAYEPIRDPQQQIIGALYVGLLESPFLAAKTSVVVRFLVMMTIATTASLVLIFLVLAIVMRPISRIVDMSQQVISGDFTVRVGMRPRGEMGLLCEAVDRMADAVAQREFQLQQSVRQQVTRAEKLASIGRLAAGVAHEINNPLTGVLTFAHLLHAKPNMDDQDREDLDLIIRETTRAADIVRGLLDFARERPVLMERVGLNEVVMRTVRLIANQKKFEHIVIEQLLLEDLPDVHADMNQLQQVLLNLALNACSAMPQGGTLTIRTATADDEVILKVTDTGCGIKPELLDRIFEPFFTTQEVGKGTGLGLSVTYGIIEQHGGHLEVHSQEGQGSTFTIYLPALP